MQAHTHANEWWTSPAASAPVSLLCDLDGTLLDFAESPEQVTVPEDLVPTLNALHSALHTAVAIVSGRSMQSLDDLLRGFHGIRAGLHGAQFRHPDPTVTLGDESIARLPADAVLLLRIFMEDYPTLLIEDKGPCIALHHRRSVTEANSLELRLRLLMLPFVGLQVLQGHQVIEIRPINATKGIAASKLLDRAEFAGRMPICLGDDTTDIDLFQVVRERGGVAIAVGERLAEYANYVLPTPGEARAWVTRLLDEQNDLPTSSR